LCIHGGHTVGSFYSNRPSNPCSYKFLKKMTLSRWLDAFVPVLLIMAPLPSFFIVGPPRTGTTWLHEVLRHRTILPHTTKETRFFDIHFDKGLRWYQAHYNGSNGRWPVGEIAPTYFASGEACHRIRQLFPAAKIVCIFRNPVERLISLYRVKRAYGIIPWRFEDAVVLDRELIESGRYATHLRAWQQAFGSDQVLATFFDDLREDPQRFVHTLADFIGIPRFTLAAHEIQAIYKSETMSHPRSYRRTHRGIQIADWLKAQHLGRLVATITRSPLRKLFLGGGVPFSPLTQELSQTIFDLFCDEIEQLESMVNRDLSGWKPALIARLESTVS
jgi:Sulfotransferase domain